MRATGAALTNRGRAKAVLTAVRRPLLAGLSLLCLWLLAGPALAGHVTIADDPDVDQAALDAVNQAIETTLDLFREDFGLTLDHDVRLQLTANKEDFAATLVRQGSHSRDSAANRADKSVGLSSRGKIVEDLGRQDNIAEKIFVAAHELTHQFQDQASGGRHGTVRWLSEGAADYLAAKVVERSRLGSLAAYRARWTRLVAAAAARPSLAALRGYGDWTAAENRYGGGLIYRLSDLAVLRLVELRGDRALFAFFRRLHDLDADRAFQETFGQDLDRFERQAE
jgi:hypothetical protein